MDYAISDRPISERRNAERCSTTCQVVTIHTHYDEHTDMSGWAVVRTLSGAILECRTGFLPHTSAERAFLSTLLIELFALSEDASVVVTTLTPYPVELLYACRPWVWREQDWREDGQPVANADLWDKLLPRIDERCVTWHLLANNQRMQLHARLAHRLASIAAQGNTARAGDVDYPLGIPEVEVAR